MLDTVFVTCHHFPTFWNAGATNKKVNTMKYPYYVMATVCDACHGNMTLMSQPRIRENLPKNNHINLMWCGFNTRGEARDYLKKIVKENRFL